MPYIEVSLDKIDPNPFQTRKKYDEDAALSIGTSVIKARHGLLQAPLARPNPEKDDRYQLAFGHGRIEGLRAVGKNGTTLRVEDLTDSEMKKYVLIENVNRSDLTDEEMWIALEQFRKDRGWMENKPSFITKMGNETGVHVRTIRRFYETKPILDILEIDGRQVSVSFASEVVPLVNQYDVETAAKVLEWGIKKGWSGDLLRKTQQSLRKFDESVFHDILKHEPATRVIARMTKLVENFTPEMQLELLKEIRVRRYNEDDAAAFIDRVFKGEEPQQITVVNEYEEVMNDLKKTMRHVKTWGAAQYGILGDTGWSEACEIFTEMEKHLIKLKLMRWDEL